MKKESIRHGDVEFPFAIYEIKSAATTQSVLYTHWHDEAELIFIRSGKARFHMHTAVKDLYPGDIALIIPGAIHGAIKINRTECVFDAIVFHERFVTCKYNDLAHQYLRQLLSTHNEEFCLHNQVMTAQMDEILRVYRQNGRDACLLLKGKLMEVLYRFSVSLQESGHVKNVQLEESAQIKEALLYIHNRYTEPFSLNELAKTAKLSRGYFERLFKNIVGITPFTYIQQYRIEQSMVMLAMEDMNVSQVAIACGFNDFSYFTKCFRRYAQITPREYRKQAFENLSLTPRASRYNP